VFLLSATLNTEVESLSGLLCHDPVVLKLDDDNYAKRIKQYVIKCAEDEKFLLIYAMFKLGLIKGKTIVFVGDTDRSYRVKLFLEQFGIRACVLNSEVSGNVTTACKTVADVVPPRYSFHSHPAYTSSKNLIRMSTTSSSRPMRRRYWVRGRLAANRGPRRSPSLPVLPSAQLVSHEG